MPRFILLAAICLSLAACQTTRNREVDSQTEFDAAAKQQRQNIAHLCEQISSEVQRRRCLGD